MSPTRRAYAFGLLSRLADPRPGLALRDSCFTRFRGTLQMRRRPKTAVFPVAAASMRPLGGALAGLRASSQTPWKTFLWAIYCDDTFLVFSTLSLLY